MTNLKTSRAAITTITAEHVNLELPLQLSQIWNVRAHCIPKCHDMIFERLLSGNRCLVTPHIMFPSLSLLMSMRWRESKCPRNLIKIKAITGNAQRRTKEEKINWLVDFGPLVRRKARVFERPAQLGAS